MPRKHASRAIIVLESPWELDDDDANRSSVLPFIEGVAKLGGDMDVLHANYYDDASMLSAVACLAKSKYKNAIVYIAAHGADGQAGDVDLMSIFAAVQLFADDCNITGVLIGSCFGAEDLTKLQVGITKSNLRWCAGYASSAYWLKGTLVDCAILAQMSELPPAAYRNGDKMIAALAHAVSLFSPRIAIGEDCDDQQVSLAASLRFVIQPDGQGHQARDVSAQVFDCHEVLQLDEDDEDDDEE